LSGIQGNLPTDYFHKSLGNVLYDKCGLSRSKVGLEQAIGQIRSLREQFYCELLLPVEPDLNGELEKAGRVADYTCQLHMRAFSDGDTIYVEPFRAAAFPIKCDLKVDRSAFDRIIQAGGYISAGTGGAPEANTILISHDAAEGAFERPL
jgi:Fumarate reductase flavoprotein C-term